MTVLEFVTGHSNQYNRTRVVGDLRSKDIIRAAVSRVQTVDEIRKRIVTDDKMRPVAVQIDYDDWVKIERALEQSPKGNGPTDLSRHVGRLRWPIDGLEYQRQVRGEWE